MSFKQLVAGLFLICSISSYGQDLQRFNNDGVSTLSHIMKENMCAGVQQGRLSQKIKLKEDLLSDNNRYYGVTSEGDIAVAYRSNGVAFLELYICERPGLTGPGMISSEFIFNNSPSCIVDEISAGNVMLAAENNFHYSLMFYPIHVEGTNIKSSLCLDRPELNKDDTSRNSSKDYESNLIGSSNSTSSVTQE